MERLFTRHWEMESGSRGLTLLGLPSEILLRVLVLLQPHDWAQVAQTCKALCAECDIAMKTLMFLDLKNGGFLLNDYYFSSLSERVGSKLRRLELDCWHLSDSSLERLPESVEELVLCGCDHHSNEILSNVSCRLNGKLRIFAWSGFGGGTISAKGFEDLALNNRGLTSFMIDCGTTVDINQAVCTVAKNCPALRELSACNLTLYCQANSPEFSALVLRVILNIVLGRVSRGKLSASSISFQETLIYMFDCGISLQCLRHKQRQASSFHITDETISLISGKCSFLKELHLVDKTTTDFVVTDSGLLHLAERASTLRILKLKPAQCTTASEVAIMQCTLYRKDY